MASSLDKESLFINRSSWTSSLQNTRTTLSTNESNPASKSRAASITSKSSFLFFSRAWHTRSCIFLCEILFRSFSLDLSEKTIPAKIFLSTLPLTRASGKLTFISSKTSSYSYISLDRRSASIMIAPLDASIFETLLLPQLIFPVKPITNIPTPT